MVKAMHSLHHLPGLGLRTAQTDEWVVSDRHRFIEDSYCAVFGSRRSRTADRSANRRRSCLPVNKAKCFRHIARPSTPHCARNNRTMLLPVETPARCANTFSLNTSAHGPVTCSGRPLANSQDRSRFVTNPEREPHDCIHPPSNTPSPWTIQTLNPRSIYDWPFTRARRDAFWLTHTTGVRVTELALLEVADVLYPSGAIKPEVYLRAEITKGCRPRNVYLPHPRCLDALEGWIAVRLRCRWGLSGTDEYRGLHPGSKLVTTKGSAFELAFKHRELDGGPEVYRACD